MKKILALALLAISTTVSANNIVVNGTRFIYPSNEREITIQMTNNASRPALVQTWLDDGAPNASPDDLDVPFTITPPVSRVEGNTGQALRIRNIKKTGIPTDRESLWYLNVLEIPPSTSSASKSDQSSLLMAIRSRFKFFYRPAGLGSVDKAPASLQFGVSGNAVSVNNPTPFYITIVRIVKGSSQKINSATVMVAPKSTSTIPLISSVGHGEKVTVGIINDYGAISDYKFNIK